MTRLPPRAANRFVVAAALLSAAPVLGQTPAPPAARTEQREARVHTRGDPLEGLNRGLFSAHQTLDKAIFRPLALGFRKIVPRPIRSGLRNFLRNLKEPVVFINDLLQLKPRRAARTLARFAINSTFGIGGIDDVAKHEKFPYRSNGLGNTLGHYGVGPGPYLFVPLIGPTDLRDLIGGQVDRTVVPTVAGRPFDRTEYQIVTGVVGGLDARAEADADLRALLGGAADPYATLRSVFLQSRAAEIRALKGGNAADAAFDDPLMDPEAGCGPSGDSPAGAVPVPAPADPPAEATESADTAPEPQEPSIKEAPTDEPPVPSAALPMPFARSTGTACTY